MASTIISPLGAAIKATLDTLSVTGYWPPVAMPDTLPAAMVQPPALRRHDPEDGESQMGAFDWRVAFNVSAYFDLSDTATAQNTGMEFFEAFVASVDANPTLGITGFGVDAVVTSGQPDYSKIADTRPVFIYDCTVETFCLVQ